jgi:AcrR family transcriptional regulator
MSLREEILTVSKDLLIEDGFGKLSMRKIAMRANVTATSIYLHFKNKDELLLTLVQESIESLKKVLFSVIDDSLDAMTQLHKLANAYIQYAIDHPKKYEIIYMVRPEEMPKYPKEKFREIRSVYELLADIIQRGKLVGELDVDNHLTSAYSVWAQLHGVVSVILNKRLDTRIPQHQFIEQSVNHIMQGFKIQQSAV